MISRRIPCYYAELLGALAEALLAEAAPEAEPLAARVAEAIIEPLAIEPLAIEPLAIEPLAIDPLAIGALESPHDEPLHPPHDEPLHPPPHEDPLQPPEDPLELPELPYEEPDQLEPYEVAVGALGEAYVFHVLLLPVCRDQDDLHFPRQSARAVSTTV